MANDQQKGGSVVLRERYLIFPGAPLPDFATPTAQAFLAEDRRDQNRALFALIVRPGFPARLNIMRALKGRECPGLLMLAEWGVVDWPPANRKVMAVVYERPLGGRVMTSLTADFKAVDEADVIRKVINPVAAALKELHSHNVTHRAIRPTNMFWATPDKERIVLGDCATAPPALEQPSLMEPVESIMTLPGGRGAGTLADDIYAFGASLAVLLQGRCVAATVDDETVLRRKIVQGSYAILVGEARLPLAMIEVLRGTLCDDPNERWTTESLDLWLSGRRLSPLLAKIEKRAARAFVFNNKEYFTARELALAFGRHWEAATACITDGRLELWLRRSLDQKEKATAIGTLTGNALTSALDKRLALDVMVTKACLILDARGPIRYKGLAVMPDGFGSLLALTMVEGGELRLLAELLMREIPQVWFETRDAYNPDNSVLEGMYRNLKNYLERSTIGFGIERVLYELNESMPCVSPATVDDYVLELRDLLPALNASKRAEGKGWPIDRHVAAFIVARTSFDIERQMADLTMPDPERSIMGMLNLLAVIQWRLGQGGLLNLASWVGGLMQPAINSYHSRAKRRELEKEIPRIVREGNLVELSRLLDSPEERAKDMRGFEQARAEWAMAQQEISAIEAGNISNHEDAIRTAQQMAALVSVTISFITVSLLLIAKVF